MVFLLFHTLRFAASHILAPLHHISALLHHTFLLHYITLLLRCVTPSCRFTPTVAPTKATVFPLVQKEALNEQAGKISAALTAAGLSNIIDTTGAATLLLLLLMLLMLMLRKVCY
jgi:hypothetical protein